MHIIRRCIGLVVVRVRVRVRVTFCMHNLTLVLHFATCDHIVALFCAVCGPDMQCVQLAKCKE